MEPMTLGSAPSSPSTSPNINPNYLPAFLMGETPTQTPTRGNLSPSKNRSFGYKTPTSGAEQRALHQRLFSQTVQEQPSFNLSAVASEKVGPPSRGLFDENVNDTSDLNNRNDSRQILMSPTADSKKSFTSPQSHLNYSRNLNDSLSKSHPFKKLDDGVLWVTILGFPPHAASLVLAQFAQCGTITEKRFPQEGNWVHLKFSARHEVAKALSYNGKLICNTIMVGVVPYNSSENKENARSEFTPVTSPNRARSLTQPYVVNHSAEIASPQNVPQRSTGLVTKAMEYVFGW